MHQEVPKTMKAAYMQNKLDITIEEIPVPDLNSDEILIKVMAVGVCGSDVHYYEHGRIGDAIVEKPMILGHECSGTVAGIGSEVIDFQIGDRVAVEPGITCGRCEACKEGKYNLCPKVMFLATPPVDGAFAQYIKMRHDFIFPIPDELTFEEAALNEPLSVGIHAANRAGLKPGSTLSILGMGPVGLMTVVAAREYGAREIIVADLEPIRLEAAKKLGATHVINVKDQNIVEEVGSITSGRGVDVAFETAGNTKALESALGTVKRGGKLAIVGLPPESKAPLDVHYITSHEVDVLGIFRYANTYTQGINFLSSTTADVKALITDRYPLEQTHEALERARTNKSGSLKVMVYPNGL
ncbi:NAD(P)-dependent alcohol dehydrogenase [Mesobacillus foraminis]|nr:NAD(P)-dependent alcohol dehydrogenase [Mesobacillus foraminis]MBT2759303.1 NAD(P)-dependent alcohol dehydrogenase [Mesobacillus foraminis]